MVVWQNLGLETLPLDIQIDNLSWHTYKGKVEVMSRFENARSHIFLKYQLILRHRNAIRRDCVKLR